MRVKEVLKEDEFNTDLIEKVPGIEDVRKLAEYFLIAGFEIRLVGGVVRDLLSGKTPKDVDLCTNATPDEMVELGRANRLHVIETGPQHGTLTFVINHEPYEVTTLRIDTATDGRHAEVAFGPNLNPALLQKFLDMGFSLDNEYAHETLMEAFRRITQ